MKITLFIVLSAAVLTGCQSKLAKDGLIDENINGFESKDLDISNMNDPSVVLLNDPYYEFGVTDGNKFELSMKVTFPAGYYIFSASFQMHEVGSMVNWTVGVSPVDSSDFESDNTFTADYDIYRGGEFEIRAEVELVKIADNSPLTIYSEPMSMKVLYPGWEEIQNEMQDEFDETWGDSKANPARNDMDTIFF